MVDHEEVEQVGEERLALFVVEDVEEQQQRTEMSDQ